MSGFRPRGHFDPVLLETFFRIEHMFAAIYESQKENGG
jgi:response regulator RpfG family c-di-GMP phosphodiesterase